MSENGRRIRRRGQRVLVVRSRLRPGYALVVAVAGHAMIELHLDQRAPRRNRSPSQAAKRLAKQQRRQVDGRGTSPSRMMRRGRPTGWPTAARLACMQRRISVQRLLGERSPSSCPDTPSRSDVRPTTFRPWAINRVRPGRTASSSSFHRFLTYAWMNPRPIPTPARAHTMSFRVHGQGARDDAHALALAWLNIVGKL